MTSCTQIGEQPKKAKAAPNTSVLDLLVCPVVVHPADCFDELIESRARRDSVRVSDP